MDTPLPNLAHVTANESVLAKFLALYLGTDTVRVEEVTDRSAFAVRLRSSAWKAGSHAEPRIALARQMLGRLNVSTIRIATPLEHGSLIGYEIRTSGKGEVVLLAAGVRPAPEHKSLTLSDPRYAEETPCA